MNSLEQIFDERKLNLKFNTSYPLNPTDWAEYRSADYLPFDGVRELSFYVHIPFCQKLCSFCEYARFKTPNITVQRQYLHRLRFDIENFITKYPNFILCGFDIGGGTPTALSEDNFEYLIEIYKNTLKRISLRKDFEPSIEGTFDTLTENKIQRICKAGIKRLSLGLQTTQSNVLIANNRIEFSVKKADKWIKYAKNCGIEKINLDFMYGLEQQTIQDIYSDIETIKYLNPEQVTLYELRTNMLNVNYTLDKDLLFHYYETMYNKLLKLGYNARFGQNTFSKSHSDFGASSYLRNRMLYAKPYKGFGISAQSMNKYGISYNVGKTHKHLSKVLNNNEFIEEYTYILPKQELLSKYIAISGYYGGFSLKIATEILGIDSKQCFEEEINFCTDSNLLTLDNDFLHITKKGFRDYGTVFSLFYKKLTM